MRYPAGKRTGGTTESAVLVEEELKTEYSRIIREDERRKPTRDALDEVMGPAAGVDPATDDLAREWLARDGKRWRPYLATAIWMALESEGCAEAPAFTDDVRKLAVAIECFHKASLIHDDIEDGDDIRYGAPTLHAEHGVAPPARRGEGERRDRHDKGSGKSKRANRGHRGGGSYEDQDDEEGTKMFELSISSLRLFEQKLIASLGATAYTSGTRARTRATL